MKIPKYFFIILFLSTPFTILSSISKSSPAIDDNSPIVSKINSIVTDTTLQKFLAKQLHIILTPHPDLETYLSRQGIILLFNNNQFGSPDFFRVSDILPIISSSKAITSFAFNYNKENPILSHYRLDWKKDSSVVSLLFPADIQLITGLDKVGLDSLFFSQMSSVRQLSSVYKKDIPSDVEQNLEKSDYNFFMLSDTEFFGYSNSAWFTKSDKAISPVRSTQFSSQTIANFLQGFLPISSGIRLDLEHRQYSGPKTLSGISLNSLLLVLSADHAILTAQDEGPDSLVSTILFYNPRYNYIHLCYFTFPLEEALKNIPVTVSAKIYSYIRIDNVRDFFKQYEEKDPLFKFKLEK